MGQPHSTSDKKSGTILPTPFLPSAWWRAHKSKETYRYLLSGLNGAGKTSILYKMKLGHVVTTIPTTGFNVESVQFQGHEITAWDVGGRSKIRPLERHFYKGVDAVVFVVDSMDTDNLDHASDQLRYQMDDFLLEHVPFLILCNKQDLPGAMDPAAIGKRLLDGIKDGELYDDHMCFVQGCSVVDGGIGISEGIEKLGDYLERNTSRRVTATAESNSFQLPKFDMRLTLQDFSMIQKNSQCPFAKRAKLWGGKHFHDLENATIEEQAAANVEALIEFTKQSNSGHKLDGYCLEVNDPLARGSNPEDFGECVRRMLTALAARDPSGHDFIKDMRSVGSRGWRFRFNQTDFFVTTFAPCYPPSSSRYTFGCQRAFLLLQPELSFARHNLPPDTITTEWNVPKTIRDKTRVAFRNAGRPYYIPDTVNYPMAEHIVKPLNDDGKEVIRWWEVPQ